MTLKGGFDGDDEIAVRAPRARREEDRQDRAPARDHLHDDLPKTRSGKIMRRLLRDVARGRPLGDVTTLANAEIVEQIHEMVEAGAAEE